MSIKTIQVVITGSGALLMNNPQTVDTMNPYQKQISKITKKRIKTEDEFSKLHDLEIRAKIYWEDDRLVIPSAWLTAAIHANAHAIEKISKAKSRSGLFATTPYIPLSYDKQRSVKTPDDIVNNNFFRVTKILKQGQVRICKAIPIFNGWSFETELEFDDTVVDFYQLKNIITHAAKYGGFGDFRPTYGRAAAKVTLA